MNRLRLQHGAMLIQVLIGVFVAGILATVAVSSLSNFRESQNITNSTDSVVSLLNEARARTLAGDNDSQYGVRLAAGSATLFAGTTYVSGAATNKVIALDVNTTITSISLNGGGSDVIFSQLTGETTQYGTLIVKRSSTTEGQRTITIVRTGIISSN